MIPEGGRSPRQVKIVLLNVQNTKMDNFNLAKSLRSTSKIIYFLLKKNSFTPIFQNIVHYISEILPTYFKDIVLYISEILPTYFKDIVHYISEILPTYFKDIVHYISEILPTF